MLKRLMLAGATLLALATPALALASPAKFAWFDYKGVEPGPAVPAGGYRNPILQGFYPDPSVLRVGDDYYLVNSSFSWFPGIPVWHSRDLVHWHQIANAISRPGQLDFKTLPMSRGVYAPQISYHADRFFIINTCVDCGGNYVVTATNPAGPWSNPVFLPQVGGIDPSIFWDEDGTAWIVNNDDPAGPARYAGHRAIRLHHVDPLTWRDIGEQRVIVDSGAFPQDKPIWIEGPHLYKVNGRYYLMCAEGGTSTGHSEVIFRADSLAGPFVPAPRAVNPILTQRDLTPPGPVTSTGHADLVQTPAGDWWAVFLGTRPYGDDLYNTGRETFLLPVTWRDGWPIILPHGTPVPLTGRRPALPLDTAPPQSGSFEARDDFTAPALGREWLTMRVPAQPFWTLGGGVLTIEPGSDGIGDMGHPHFLGRRQQHADATATTSLTFDAAEGESAGIAAIQNDEFFLSLALTRRDGKPMLRLARRDGKADPAAGKTVAEVPLSLSPGAAVQLRVHARGGAYDFDYAVTPGRWQPVAHDVDGTNLSTNKAGGFVGTFIGLFAAAAR